MIFKNYEWKILIRIIFLFVTLCIMAWLLVTKYFLWFALGMPVLIFEIVDIFRFQKKAYTELDQFVESVHYRDFSRHFDVLHAPVEVQSLRKGFNEINSAFKIISKEKETQYQYLQKILELVDTGILSFETASGQVVWMNESLKKMLEIPYLKTIHSLSRRDNNLYEEILSLQIGEGRVATAQLQSASFKIFLSATAFQTDGKTYKLVAFQNVNEAIDETESKAWQKLLSVLTHEIMNSIAPISSLADTLRKRLQQMEPVKENEGGLVDDLGVGIDTIKRRSQGLLQFAETYKSLNKISKLHLQRVYVKDIFENLLQLMQPGLEQKNIEIETILQEIDLQVEADANLVEQVMINLLVNAIDAVKGQDLPRIILSAYTTSKNRVVVKVADNGVGMHASMMEKIFIPFFSTKKSGSGIGLSLCKQIMILHKGNIRAQSIEGKGSVFFLQF